MITRTRSALSLGSQEENKHEVNSKQKTEAKATKMTRSQSKRRLEIEEDQAKVTQVVKRCFVNLTNVKSPKSRKVINTANKVTNYFSVAPKNQSTSSLHQMADSTQLSQSGEIVLSQIPNKSLSANSKEDIVSAMRGFKRALEKNFKDVSDRLQLQSVPPLLYDLKDFQKNYSKTANIDFSKSESEYMARSFLSDNRPFLFINYVRNTILGQKEFPGSDVLRGILELIMKIKDEEEKSLGISTQQSINELYSLFSSIFITFPHTSLQNSYLELFKSPFNHTKTFEKTKEKSSLLKQPGVLQSMLDLLTELIQREDSIHALNHSNSQENINFFLWDKRSEEKSSFKHFPRDEKFERIFIVLDLVTTVLENDLAIFIIKHSNLRTFNNNNEQLPLIYLIVWQQHEEEMRINEMIKNILFIFVNSIALNYPRKNVQVMARLVNTLSHVMNLNEYSNETEYPSYKNNSKSLVQEILKTIESSAYYNIGLVTSVAEHLRSPLTRMLLVNHFVQKIHNTCMPISLEVPFDLIRKKEFLKFNNILIPKTVNNEKYPVIDVNKQASQFEVNQRSYLKLLRIYAESVNNYYCIQAGLIEIKSSNRGEEVKKTHSAVPLVNQFNFDNFEEKIKETNLDELVELRKVDLTFKKQISIKLSKESCEFYLREINNFYLLSKLIKKCHEKFGAKFDDWMNLIYKMEVKD